MSARSTAQKARPMTTTPTLKLRRIIWPDGSTSIDREDFDVIDERGERIGRMYRTIAVGGGHAWRWSVYGIATYNKPPAGLARADTREGDGRVQGKKCKPRERGA
jgi:hypothetical protein